MESFKDFSNLSIVSWEWVEEVRHRPSAILLNALLSGEASPDHLLTDLAGLVTGEISSRVHGIPSSLRYGWLDELVSLNPVTVTSPRDMDLNLMQVHLFNLEAESVVCRHCDTNFAKRL